VPSVAINERSTRSDAGSILHRPANIGPYKVLDTLGEGGMGIVYLVEQERPLRRRVALKVIKIGMDTRDVIARFESERQALALMDHPHIAQVYDAGASEDGRPYFAMEHVPGIPITEYCDKHRLHTRARLQLFVAVCGAIQHAHQKGIIHRDLKPSNVLVMLQDGQPVPKIIDFGVAKATHQRLTEKTVFTQLGFLIGTPEYMSPEQAEMSGLTVDTTTDIYSLGVLLYELLVGVLPFDAVRLRRAGYEEIQRIIREEEPPRPSSRLSGLGAQATEVAKRRQSDLSTLSRQVKRDLDWITLKAMEKDRTRRYPSASELAADIHRYLADEPVIARPPSGVYRMQKLYKRRRGAVLAVSSLIAALGFGFAASLFLYAQARAAGERAQREGYVATIRAADLSLRSGDAEETRHQLEVAVLDLRGWEWRHLAARLDSSTRVLQVGVPVHHVASSQTGEVTAIAQEFGPGGSWRALTWPAGAIAPSKLVQPMLPSGLRSALLAVSADRGLLLADDSVIVQHSPTSWGFKDSVLRIYDQASGSVVRQLGPYDFSGLIPAAAFSPDGKRVVTAGQGVLPKLQLWDVSGQTSVPLPFPRALTGGPSCVAFSPDNTQAAYAESGSVYLLDAAGTRRFVFETENAEGICILAFSPDGSLLLKLPSSGPGRALGRLWETFSGRLVGVIEDNWWTAVSFSRDGHTIALGGRNGRIQIIDVPRFDRPSAFQTSPTSDFFGHRGAVRTLAFGSDGVSLVSGSDDGTVRVWDTTSTGEYRSFRAEGQVVSVLSMSRDGAMAASAEGRVARIWQTRPMETLATTGIHDAEITSLTLNTNGSRLVTGAADGTVHLWSVGDSSPLVTFRAQDGQVNAVAVDPGGTFVASGGKEQKIRMWDTRSKRELGGLEGHTGPVTALSMHPDGQLIVSGSDDGTVRIWQVPDTRLVRTLTGHQAPITSVAVSNDGTRILSSSVDGSIRVWSLSTGAELAVLRGHARVVTSAVFNSDATRIASGSLDRTIRVWDSALGVPLLVLSNSDDLPSAVLFIAGGTRLVSASYGGTFRVWEATVTPILGDRVADRRPAPLAR
jgi:WD40 repeat protein/serine/threonine protein kinase